MKRLAHSLFALMLGISCVFGWDGTGHMTVAYIAYQQLTPAEQDALVAILMNHPDHRKWAQKIPASDKARIKLATFVRAAAWPDDIRSDPRFYDDTARDKVKNPPTPIPAGFPGVDLVPEGTSKIHKDWHFINEPLDGKLDALKAFDDHGAFRTPPTILTKIADADAALRNDNSSVRAYYLPWLIHLIGDVHQPLHTVAHIIRHGAGGQPIGDVGGNSVKIVLFQNTTMPRAVDNLHSFWDDSLGQTTDLDAIQKLGDTLMGLHPKDDKSSEVKSDVWFVESADDAIKVVYKDLAPAEVNDKGLTIIPDGYFATANKLSGQRVAEAGYRLAAVLKASLSATGGK